MRATKTIIILLAAGVVWYILFVSFLVFQPYLSNYFNRTDFDSKKWKNWTETVEDPSLRWNMIADLEDKYHLVGMTEKEIIDLLGQPESKGPSDWYYYLGMSGHGIDSGTLSLNFEEGSVKSYRTYRS